MIITEEFTLPEQETVLIKTYSDEGYMLIQEETGILYSEAIDPKEANRSYIESDQKINQDEEEKDINIREFFSKLF